MYQVMNDHDQLPQRSLYPKVGANSSQYSNISEKASNKKTLEQQKSDQSAPMSAYIQPSQQPGGS